MNHREYLNLIGQDPDEDPTDNDTYRMEIMDRLLDYAPAGAPNLVLSSAASPASPPSGGTRDTTGRQPKTCDICVEQIPERVRRRYRREHADERRAAAVLYGASTRSGNVTDIASVKTQHSLRTIESDIPFGMTLDQWRHAS